jgi:hypothetical protein
MKKENDANTMEGGGGAPQGGGNQPKGKPGK